MVMLLVVFAGCGNKHETPEPSDRDIERLRDPTIVPGTRAPAEGGPTVKTEAEAIALDNTIMKRVVEIYAADGADCEKLATDLSTVVTDPKYAALNAYMEAHPSFKHEPDDASQFKEAAKRVREGCASNKRYLNVLMSF